MDAREFVNLVSRVRLPSVFNPYADLCTTWDLPDAPARRRANLEAFLNAALQSEVRTLWMGRDLGYRGGRRTGIALTDEANLDGASEMYAEKPILRRATKGPPVAERTAAVVWNMISKVSAPIFTWNVFPLHPHESGKPMTNRCHTAVEREAVSSITMSLIELLRPSLIVAIGNDAAFGLEKLSLPHIKVRHPSYGGIADFERGVATHYGLRDTLQSEKQLDLL